MYYIFGISIIINFVEEDFCMIVGIKFMRIVFYCLIVFVVNYRKVLLVYLEF